MIRPAARSCAILRFSRIVSIVAPCLAVAWLVIAAAPARAQNKFWVSGAGGTFGSSTNWSTTGGGASGAAPPGAAETANFTQASTYTVNFGADVINTGLSVANGTVTFDLNGNEYFISGAAGTTISTVAGQTGRLIVTDGTLGVDTAGDDIAVGFTSGAIGFLTVSTGGRLGNGTLDPDLIVGASGTGTFALDDNGRADIGTLNVAQGEGSTGTVTVSGPNAILDSSGSVSVGLAGTGSLTIQNAASMTTTGGTTIGNVLGANGVVSVNGTSATWNHLGTLVVADAGDGGFTVQSSGIVNTSGAITIANSATGAGSAIVTGIDSVWTMGSLLTIGNSGFGNLAFSSGGRATTAGGTVLGNNVGGEGNLVITGAGTRWTSGAITVGSSGAGVMNITAAAVVNTTGAVNLAASNNSTGRVTVSGENTIWNVTGALTVGGAGSGTLTVDTGASLTTTSALSITDPAGAANGTFNFQGGTVNVNSFVRSAGTNFNWTDGTFIINGGTFNNGGQNLVVNGADGDDLPALRLAAGATSTIANLPNLTVGSSRQGAVVISGGSSFQTTTTSVGQLDGSSGALLVEGVNSTFSTTGDLNVGGTAVTGGGIGTLTLGNSGKITAGGALRLWNGATVNMNGGTLVFNTFVANGGRVNFTSGTIQTMNNLNLNSNFLNAVTGSTHVLGTGRRIDVNGSTAILESDLTVDGGIFSGGGLSIASGVVTRVQNGGSATFGNGVINAAGARMFVTDSSVSAGGAAFVNSGELQLSGTTATVSATVIQNSGLIAGSGRINNAMTNQSAGQVRVAAGQRLEILGSSGTNLNDGLIDVDGGTIEFSRVVVNSLTSPSSGMIAARNATLRFGGGLTNSGALTFTSGVSDVFGDVSNLNNLTTPGRIIVTGGAQANFFDDVSNAGAIQVSASGGLQSVAVFLGALSGNAPVGTGHIFTEGDVRPGFSPGTMAFGGDLSIGPLSRLQIELGGTTPGTQYDRVTVAGTANLGGTLEVSLINGFKPAAGNNFQIFSAPNGYNASFAATSLPQLSGGLDWKLNYNATNVTLNVGGVLGDYNLDGTVNTADYVVWRNLLNTNSAVADGSGNGVVDQDDYNVWRGHFGLVASVGSGAGIGSAAAVPEPTSAVLACVFAAISLAATSRNRRPDL